MALPPKYILNLTNAPTTSTILVQASSMPSRVTQQSSAALLLP